MREILGYSDPDIIKTKFPVYPQLSNTNSLTKNQHIYDFKPFKLFSLLMLQFRIEKDKNYNHVTFSPPKNTSPIISLAMVNDNEEHIIWLNLNQVH